MAASKNLPHADFIGIYDQVEKEIRKLNGCLGVLQNALIAGDEKERQDMRIYNSQLESLVHNISLERQKHSKELEQVRKSREILAQHEAKAEATERSIKDLESEKSAFQAEGVPGEEWRAQRQVKAEEKADFLQRISVLSTDIVAKANSDFDIHFKTVDEIMRYLKQQNLLQGFKAHKRSIDQLKEEKRVLFNGAASLLFLMCGNKSEIPDLKGADDENEDEDADANCNSEALPLDADVAPLDTMPPAALLASPTVAPGTAAAASTMTSNLEDASACAGTSRETPIEVRDRVEREITQPEDVVPENYEGQGDSEEMNAILLSASNAADPLINVEPDAFSQDGDDIVANLGATSDEGCDDTAANHAVSGSGDKSPPALSDPETDCEDENCSSGGSQNSCDMSQDNSDGSQNSGDGSGNSSDGSEKSMATVSQAIVAINESPRKGKKRPREDSSRATAQSELVASSAEVIGERIVRAKMSEELKSPSSSKEVHKPTTPVKASKTTEHGHSNAPQRQGIWSKSTAAKDSMAIRVGQQVDIETERV